MQYMLLIYNCVRPEPGDPGFEEAVARVNAFADECRRRGVWVEGKPLQPESTATTVSVRDGRTLITDGPFAETHEHLGGFYLFDCRNLDEALELAALCPMAAEGSIEVRPVVGIPGVGHAPVDVVAPAE
ncbi:YciI family protein [Amycolatopsis sp. NPDC023774]|uniref:YciI family protein n=1 Tax=Amycolatopsis sp. NPDC023774 TaxID=3155015 RepID=UPI00340BE060